MSIIPEEDFREAIAVCRKDPQLNRLFEMAPPGARLFIGLSFYSTHFGDKVDPRQYAECQAEIEPALTINDLKYLIRFERDKNTKRYLRELLVQREAESAAEEETAEEAPPPKPSKLRHSLLKRKPPATPQAEPMLPAKYMFPHVWHKSKVAPVKSSRGFSITFDFDIFALLKFAAQVAILLGGAFYLYVATRSSDPQAATEQDTETSSVAPAKKEKMPPAAAQPVAPPKQVPSTDRPPDRIDVAEKDARLHEVNDSVGMGLEEASRSQAETNTSMAVVASKKRSARKQHVVFTDGKKILKHPGGQIEVPRVFSCAGAGIRAFWVYGTHPEADAAREKKARDEWQALVQQARQAEKEASGGTASAGADANML